MWIRLQLYENDKSKILGIAVGADGTFYFRATDAVRLMGWEKDPWSPLDRLMPTNRPVHRVVPRDIPLSFGKMKVVTYPEMIAAMTRVANTCNSFDLRTRNQNLVEYIQRVFRDASVEKSSLDVFYTTNPARAATFKIVFDDDERSESLESLLGRAHHKFLDMYRRLTPIYPRPQPKEKIIERDEDEGRLVIDEERRDDDEAMETDSVFKIQSRSAPAPAVIEWFDGETTHTYRCWKFSRGREGEKITLHRNENTLEAQVIEN